MYQGLTNFVVRRFNSIPYIQKGVPGAAAGVGAGGLQAPPNHNPSHPVTTLPPPLPLPVPPRSSIDAMTVILQSPNRSYIWNDAKLYYIWVMLHFHRMRQQS